MFSALKKLVGSEQAPGRDKNIPAGLQSMNQALQRRFAKGVQYNSECRPARGLPARGTWEVGSEGPGGGGAAPRGPQARPRRLGLGGDQVAARTRKHGGPCRAPGASRSAGGCGRSCSSVVQICCALTCGGYPRGLHLGSGVDAGPETRSWRTPGVEGGRLGPWRSPRTAGSLPRSGGAGSNPCASFARGSASRRFLVRSAGP